MQAADIFEREGSEKPPLSGRLILASASAARAALLDAAGIDVEKRPAEIDEAAIKQRLRHASLDAATCALALAEAKARAVSRDHPDSLVIGADQMLVCEGEWFDKPADLAAARAQLGRLRGREHALPTAVCVVEKGSVLWRKVSTPLLSMRDFSDRFLDAYLLAEGDAVLGSVGAYRLEGRGAQLFETISGDYFAILGLPLLELADFLRRRGVLPA